MLYTNYFFFTFQILTQSNLEAFRLTRSQFVADIIVLLADISVRYMKTFHGSFINVIKEYS